MAEYYSQNNSTMGGFGGVAKTSAFELGETDKQRIALGTEEIKKELLEKWNEENAGVQVFPAPIALLHPDVIDFLLSFDRVAEYDDIARQANLSQQQRNTLPQIVWQAAVSKNWTELPRMVSENAAVNPALATVLLQNLEQKIVGKIKMLSEKPLAQKTAIASEQVKKEDSLPLKDALEKYPRLGEQQVTSNMLKLKYFPEPVRPSIKNWITDYHDNMGSGKHEVMDRGNFLFHSENGKSLVSDERQKLTLVLRALDDGTPVRIDPEKQVMLFAGTNESPIKNESNTNSAIPAPSQPARQEFTFNVQHAQPAPAPAPSRPVSPAANNPAQNFRPTPAPAPQARPVVPSPAPQFGQTADQRYKPQPQPQFQPEPQPQPHYQSPIPPAPKKQNPVVDLKDFPGRVMTAPDIKSHAAYPAVASGGAMQAPAQEPAFHEGNLSILHDQTEKEQTSASAPFIHKDEPGFGYRGEVEQHTEKEDKLSALVNGGATLGSEKYFTDFSKADSGVGETVFAAPQQFPAEMATPPQAQQPSQPDVTPAPAPAPIAQAQPAFKTQQPQPQPQTSRPQAVQNDRRFPHVDHAPYRITPMEDKYFDEDALPKDDGPKVSGNVVDLR